MLAFKYFILHFKTGLIFHSFHTLNSVYSFNGFEAKFKIARISILVSTIITFERKNNTFMDIYSRLSNASCNHNNKTPNFSVVRPSCMTYIYRYEVPLWVIYDEVIGVDNVS